MSSWWWLSPASLLSCCVWTAIQSTHLIFEVSYFTHVCVVTILPKLPILTVFPFSHHLQPSQSLNYLFWLYFPIPSWVPWNDGPPSSFCVEPLDSSTINSIMMWWLLMEHTSWRIHHSYITNDRFYSWCHVIMSCHVVMLSEELCNCWQYS